VSMVCSPGATGQRRRWRVRAQGDEGESRERRGCGHWAGSARPRSGGGGVGVSMACSLGGSGSDDEDGVGVVAVVEREERQGKWRVPRKIKGNELKSESLSTLCESATSGEVFEFHSIYLILLLTRFTSCQQQPVSTCCNGNWKVL